MMGDYDTKDKKDFSGFSVFLWLFLVFCLVMLLLVKISLIRYLPKNERKVSIECPGFEATFYTTRDIEVNCTNYGY